MARKQPNTPVRHGAPSKPREHLGSVDKFVDKQSEPIAEFGWEPHGSGKYEVYFPFDDAHTFKLSDLQHYSQGISGDGFQSPADGDAATRIEGEDVLRNFDAAIDSLSAIARDASAIVAQSGEQIALIKVGNDLIERLIAANQRALDRLVERSTA